MQIAQPGMNMDQDRQMLMVEDNVGNQFRLDAVQNVRNKYGNINVVTAPAEGNGNGINGCVLFWPAFCLGLRFAQLKTFLLRFAKDKLCQTQNRVTFYLRRWRFVFKKTAFCLQEDLAFCLQVDLAFCLGSTAFCLLPRYCVLSQKCCDLSSNILQSGFKCAFATLFGQDTETFTRTMFLNMEQLEKQLDKEDFQEIGSMAALNAILEFRDTLIQRLESIMKSIDERVQLKREYGSWVNERQMQTTEEKHILRLTKVNCILENNLQQASTSGTQSDKAPVYDTDGSTEVYLSKNCYDNDIFNMFTQEEWYTEKLEPILEPHQVPQNDSNVSSEVSSMEQGGRTVEQHPANVEETRALYDSLYNNLAIEVEKVNTVNRKLRETNAELTTELARYKNQEKYFEISQEKYEKLERLVLPHRTKMALGYENPFYLKQAQQKQQSLYNGKVLLEKHDPPVVYDSEEALELAQEKAAKFVRNFKSLAKEADEFIAKQKALELEIERFLRAVVSQDIMSVVQNNSVVDTLNLQTELECMKERFENYLIKKENEYAKIWNDWYKKCEECKYDKISYYKAYNDMSTKDQTVASSVGRSQGINPFKASRVDNFVPNKHVKASVGTKPITVSQPHVITKNDVNSKTNSFSLKDVKSTTRTRRPHPRNNPKNDKQCLITVNHDVCVLNYVNGMNSRGKKQKENVSNQKKHKAHVWKPKNVGSKERLASPKPSIPRSCHRWSSTERISDLKGKIITSSKSESQSNCSKGDNACTSNPHEPISRRFPNLIFPMTGSQNWFDTLLIPLLFEYKPMDKEDHGDNECDT
nr:hypothetical protein [Tanacetum cinerariifolium]